MILHGGNGDGTCKASMGKGEFDNNNISSDSR